MNTAFTDAKRSVILDSALAEFGEWDYSAASMQRIADRAGVAKGTIYLYFRDKDELFTAAAERGWELFFREANLLFVGYGGVADHLGALMDAGFDRLRTAYPLVRGMFFETSRREILRVAVERLCALIGSKFDEMVGTPEDGARDRGRMIRIIVSGVLFEIAMTPAEKLEERLADVRDTLSDFLSTASK